MMPLQTVTPEPIRGDWLYEQRNPLVPLVDVEMGGVGYQNPDEGLAVKLWTVEYRAGSMYLRADGVPEMLLFSRAGVTEVALAFDTNMNPLVGFTDGSGTTFWYFNSLTNQMEFFPYLPAGSHSLRATLDDRRTLASPTSDIVIAYIRSGNLYMRQQRDRYQDEYLLATDAGSRIMQMGMTKVNRVQLRLVP